MVRVVVAAVQTGLVSDPFKAWQLRPGRVFPDPETRVGMTQAGLWFRSRRRDSVRNRFLTLSELLPVLSQQPPDNQSASKLCLSCPPLPPLPASLPPSIQSVSHLSSQPALITSPPPRGSYFLIAGPSCSGIPQINSPPLCYSYYLGVLELACPSKRTLYSCASFPTLPPHPSPPPPPSRPYQWSYITGGHGGGRARGRQR